MATLPDRLWRRTVELFLCAGRANDNGNLPDTKQLAWILRLNTDDLEMDLIQIASTGIIEKTPAGWNVTQFAKRQAAVQPAERMQQYRDRKQKQNYYGDGYEPVTERNVDTDTESDTETKADSEQPPQFPEPDAWKNEPPPAAPAPYIHPSRKAESLLLKCGRMAAIPSKELPRVEQVLSMIDKYTEAQVSIALTEAFRKWISTPRKNGGGNYSPLNFGWVDWAQEALMNVGADVKPAYHPNMSKEELMRYLGVKPE